ncbi:MAG TPA: lecithin retinol acyltransferase family protein [Candidatus Angelobacter sp.]|nr:lecithin retinol acyltransferase family protein [Candidatus Angelobacter sp.]
MERKVNPLYNNVIHPLYTEPADAEVFLPLDPNNPFESFAIPNALGLYELAVPVATFIPVPGDWVKVYRSELGIWHHGIVTVWNGVRAMVAHNQKGVGIINADWNVFAEGGTVHSHQRPLSNAHVQMIMTRVNDSIGKPYHLFAQNCEHFASFAFNGKPESPTVASYSMLAVLALGAVALFRD